jgi:outer membrane PBP1 activator LpoA protein
LQDEPHAAQQVALMLPLSGRLAPAGKAVLDGYLASYYAARTSGGRTAELLVLDLDRYDSAIGAYQDALARGATLVVGPLSKAAVADLGTLPERPVPILALNRAEQVLPASGSALVQMSLAPGDEAARVAELAYGRGARSALILRPAGSWGDKVEQALRQRWSALGGHLAGSATYSGRDEYSSAVKSGLDLYDSESRARDVRSMLATNIEFTARRRQDVDAIFLLSRNGPEARSIKPLLAPEVCRSTPLQASTAGFPTSGTRISTTSTWWRSPGCWERTPACGSPSPPVALHAIAGGPGCAAQGQHGPAEYGFATETAPGTVPGHI